MKYFRIISLLFLLSILLFTCKKDEDNNPNITEGAISILPLGDSRVAGASPVFESYRYELWKNLVDNNWQFDFVGTRSDNSSYPDYNNQSFDKDHEGTGGATTTDIIQTVDDISIQDAPDVVLLGIGGNDALAGVSIPNIIDNIDQIIDILQSKNDSIIIFLEQIAPGRSDIMTPALISVFDEYKNSISQIADAQSNQSSSIIVVDMSAGWSDDFMADPLHYNTAGAKDIADKYFIAIEANLDQ